MKRVSMMFACVLMLFLVPVLLLAGLSGCGNKTDTGQTEKGITVVDDAGKTIRLDKPADRVVSIVPANTEIMYALGGGNKLVGVTNFDDYPPQVKNKAKVGGFENPNVEKIVSLNPEVVLASGGVQQKIVQSLEKLGIKIFVVDPKSFNTLFSDMEKVGTLIGRKEKAEEVVKRMKGQVADVEAKVKKLPKRSVFFEIYGQPLTTAGKGTLIDMMIGMAGGTNVGAAAGPKYPQYSPEQLLRDNPDVYIAVKGSQQDPADIAKRPGYSGLTAVKDGKVYVVEDNLFVRPGPRLVQGLQILAEKIHPEAFKKGG